MGEIRNNALGSALFIICLCSLQGFSSSLELDRQQVLFGEAWRLWSGHFVHTNFMHLSLNVIAALFIYLSFFSKVKLADLLTLGFIFSPVISIALLLIHPELQWYNGFSGLLHAIVAYLSIRMIRDGKRFFGVGLSLVWLKVIAETGAAQFGYEHLIGNMVVISEAHLIGVFIGSITAIAGMALSSVTSQLTGKIKQPVTKINN